MTDQPEPSRRPEKPPRRERIRRPLSLIWAIIGVVTTVAGLLTFLLVDVRDITSALRPAPPTPTATLAPTPTPVPGPDDIVVLVPDFAGEKGAAAADRIYAALVTRVETNDLADLYPARLPGQSPLNAAQAEQVGSGYGATMVLWGRADNIGIDLHYRIMRDQDRLPVQPDVASVLSADPEALNLYVAQNAPREFDYLMLVTAAQIRYAEQKYQEAADLYSLALDIDLGERAEGFQLPRVHLHRGLAYYYSGWFDAAYADFDQAIQLDDTLSAAYEGRGAVSYAQGRFEEALSDFNTALTLTPSSISARNSRAYTLATLNRDLDRALADIEIALEAFPGSGNYLDTRGYVRTQMGDLEAALADFQAALDAGETFAYYGRGLVEEAQGDAQAARDDYQAFLQYHGGAVIQAEDARRRLAALGG